MKNQSNKLWAVKYEAQGAGYCPAALWILGDDVLIASRKAQRYLKSKGYRVIVIKTVEGRGTVDVF